MARSAALTRFQPDPTDELTLEWVMRQFTRLQTTTQGLDDTKGDEIYTERIGTYLVDISIFNAQAIKRYSSSSGNPFEFERVTLHFSNLQIDGTSDIWIRLGTSLTSTDTTGYESAATSTATRNDTTGFILYSASDFTSSDTLHGSITLERMPTSTPATEDQWIITGTTYHDDNSTATKYASAISGFKALTGYVNTWSLETGSTRKFTSGRIQGYYLRSKYRETGSP